VEVRFWPRTDTYDVTVLQEWATYNVFYVSDLDTMGYTEIINTKVYGSEYWVIKEQYTETVTSRIDYDPNPIIKRK